MTGQEIVKAPLPEDIERIVIGGDLSPLRPDQKALYYKHVCDSVGLNWITKPFDLIRFQGKEILYCNKGGAEQLRRKHSISVTKLERDRAEDLYVVTAYGKDGSGREDTGLAAVPLSGLKGEALCNAMMKAETKAKRRLTLSMSGLGMMDEMEVETIPGAQKVEISLENSPTLPQEAQTPPTPTPATTQPPEVVEANSDLFKGVPVTHPSTIQRFTDDMKEAFSTAETFTRLAALTTQNEGMARKLGCLDEFLRLKVEKSLDLMTKTERELLVEVGEAPAEYLLEFYALDEVASKGGDIRSVFIQHRPILKAAGIETKWVEYGKKLNAELKRMKED